MPFTGSHPIAVLPLRRLGLPATALVIGSMAPDVPYYLPGRPYWATHTVLGLVTVDLAVGLVLWALWVGLLRPRLMPLSPRGLRARTGPMAGLRAELSGWRRAAALPGAVLVGAATHVLWDEFTHVGRWGDHHVPVLHATYGPMPGWHWAQYLCGAAGLAGLAWCTWRWWRRTPVAHSAAPARHRWVWPVLAAVTVVAALVAVDTTMTFRRATFVAITAGLGAGVGLGLALAVTATVRDALRRRETGA